MKEQAAQNRSKAFFRVIRDSRGASLFDLMAAVTFWAILGAVATPVTYDLLESHRLSSAARQISFAIGSARSQAVGQNAAVKIRFVDGKTYVLERSESGGVFEQVGSQQKLPDGTSISGDAGTEVRFNRLGLSTVRVVLTVQNSMGTQTLEMSPLGKVTVS
jgi:Tfp pilus assembly protein FimT